MRPSDLKFMMTYMKKKDKPIEISEKSKSSIDEFDISKKQVPFKIFKRNRKEKEYSAKTQKRALSRILPNEIIHKEDGILSQIDQINEAYGYVEEIITY